jgi:Carbohydrate binding domain/Tetratricopeptide repeat
LNYQKLSADAASAFASAVALRYRDDYLWIELGNTREELGDTDGALAALDQAVRWAPYYAHTHWQRGNLLLRMNRPNEAFADLRQATTANPKYLPNLIDLAWGLSKGDLKTTEELIKITNDSERLALIRYLAGKGKGKDVIAQIQLLTTPLSIQQNTDPVRLLLASKSFREAFVLLHGSEPATPSFTNGGFEDPFVLNDVPFGWVVAPEQKRRLAVDVSDMVEGSKSLQINFDGNWAPGTPLLSQTIIVEPEQTYRVSFAVKTKDLVTGGPPLITVRDATDNQSLGKSENFPTATTSWVTFNFDFTTLTSSQAVVVRLDRNDCNATPCPIFGTLWLDRFKIEQTKSATKQ